MKPETHTIELTGLREDIGRDFLAALGLLRFLNLKWPHLECGLAWTQEKGHPVVHTVHSLPEDWCAQIVADVKSLEQHPESPLFHGEIIKADAKDFRIAVFKAIRFAADTHPLCKLPELMFAAYGSQIPDPKTGMIEPSLLSFANGQSGKSLLRDVRELIRGMDSDIMFAELSGTALPVPGKAFRWMPQEYRPAAHRAHDPGSKLKGDEPLDHPSLNILAFFGLSCIPTISTGDGGETGAFYRDAYGWSFLWPVWKHPLSPSGVMSLLTMPQDQLMNIPDVIRVWKSRRLVAEKSVYFAPASSA